MGFISHFLAGGLFNRSEMNKKLDEISDALIPSWKLIYIIDNSVGYSGTWIAPDVFGDGSPYDLGAYMIGGGGSGGAVIISLSSSSSTSKGLAKGGASGYGKNHVFEGVNPGDEYSWVVGAGGAQVSVTGDDSKDISSVDGKAGGTTSFGGITATGGEGGFASTARSTTLTVAQSIGGQPNLSEYSNVEITGYYGGVSNKYNDNVDVLPSKELQNQFDPHMITLAAGFNAYGVIDTEDVATAYKSSPAPGCAPTHGVVGTAVSTITTTAKNSVAATCGNGGGAAACAKYNTVITATSGKGGDGVIFLYARKAVTK